MSINLNVSIDKTAIEEAANRIVIEQTESVADKLVKDAINEKINVICKKHIATRLKTVDIEQVLEAKIQDVLGKKSVEKMLSEQMESAMKTYLTAQARERVLAYLKKSCEATGA